MGGFRTDGKLLEQLGLLVDWLYSEGYHESAEDVEEAIERLRPIYDAEQKKTES